ncbi:GNAT superfamily N-acetyltransferase [Kineosphaera limosa]|uniref:Putative acetyltransferase n=1 Tax=Kineosphaera limosa NBRC 100340 TaxID=1184609 RepID=K6VLC3_9MICO|nr:GNAT family N-acetyltransferase [Kineosphaera limosa]NYE00385.1 GNAT superfamily N-acetyltransferase [Kineosphaera limosa]GAB97023.1 putative acetyltransferase [Kineosphaera limosa NBRC 100340]
MDDDSAPGSTPQARARRAIEAGYVVRPAVVGDADELGAMHVQAWRESYTGIIDQQVLDDMDPQLRARRWREWLAQPQSPTQLFIGFDPDGRLVGMVSVGPARDEDSPTGEELWAINVLAAAKGSGLADALLLTALGDRPASMWVLRDNPRAHGFYARYGFAPDGTSKYDERLKADEVRLTRGAS